MHTWLPWRLFLTACWGAWCYPFAFHAPHRQQRKSVTAPVPTRIGLLLECLAIFLAALFQRSVPPGPALLLPALLLTAGSTAMGWQAVTHLGRQFRITAGLYEDHELVRSGPYALVRHPIYTSLLGMLLVTILLITPWQVAAVSLVVFVAGTEIRVRAEDALLASRFGEEFRRYRNRVPAYIPFLR